MDHDRQPRCLCGAPGELQGLDPVRPDHGPGQPDLDALDHVAVALADGDRPLGVGVAQVLQLVVQRAHHPDRGNVQIGEDPRLGDADHVAAQPLERVRTGGARVAHRRDPPAETGGVRVHAVVAHPRVHVHVHVDEARGDEVARGLQDLGCRLGLDRRRHLDDPALRDGDIPQGVWPLPRIHDCPALHHEVKHGSRLLSGSCARDSLS